MNNKSEITTRKSDAFIPWYFVGFFLVLFILDGTFVYLAVSTHTGVVQKHTYETGLAYNTVIAEGREHKKLGWRVTVEISKENIISMIVLDKDGNFLQDADVSIIVKRPTQAGHDFDVNLVAFEKSYRAQALFPLPGLWQLQIKIAKEGKSFFLNERVIVQGDQR